MADPPPTMDRHLLRVFLLRVEEQCVIALRAAQDLSAAVPNVGLPKLGDLGEPRSEQYYAALAAFHRAGRRSQSDVWQAAQTFVVAVGNLSKLFWGESGSLAAQRTPVRQAAGVSDGSVLQPTTMRNHFEHFDDRIDRWWAKSPSHNIIDQSLGAVSVSGNVDDFSFFRGYDPATTDLSFWGTRLNVLEVCVEIAAILDRVATQLDEWMGGSY